MVPNWHPRAYRLDEPAARAFHAAVSSPTNFSPIARQLEEVPLQDGGRALDTLAGVMIRILARMDRFDRSLEKFGERLAAIDDKPAGRTKPGAFRR